MSCGKGESFPELGLAQKYEPLKNVLFPPDIKPRVELVWPTGDKWEWGEPRTSERVWGSAEEFCLVVAQRRNVADTGLKWQGENVGKWLTIAQAFAGVAQDPPAPRVRVIDYQE